VSTTPESGAGYAPDPAQAYRREWIGSMNAAENLFTEMKDVLRCVEPSRANFATFGHRIRDLLILTATEVESAWKAVLLANGVTRDRLTTNDYVRVADPMRLREWRVALALHPDVPELTPFATWDAADPTESLHWYDAYNAVKHGREQNFERATLGHMLNAMAAVFIMASAQFGIYAKRSHSSLEMEDAGAALWSDHFLRIESPRWSAADAYIPPGLGEGCPEESPWIPTPRFT
jgi:hypothetical protein